MEQASTIQGPTKMDEPIYICYHMLGSNIIVVISPCIHGIQYLVRDFGIYSISVKSLL